MSSNDYVIRIHEGWETVDAARWDALLDVSEGATPFMRHAFLACLESSGSACARTGWRACPITVWQRGELVAACPVYEKTHSFGEYVFDWAWADAYERNGLPYYPKLLVGVPFTPVTGARLLARGASARQVLLEALTSQALHDQRSSVHLLFGSPADIEAARQTGWLLRCGLQFHWHNERAYADFNDFLGHLQRDKRKKILQERRRVREAGVILEALVGPEIAKEDWDFFHRCYVQTYRAHRSTPYLNRAFFEQVSTALPQQWLMFVARRGRQRVAASLLTLDPAQRVAYGRYWGALSHVDCLHFESCYYAPLEWCIAQGFRRFEGGAQGEHKLARGLQPVRTYSAHWLGHTAFRDAIARYLEREAAGMNAYLKELEAHSPLKPVRIGA